MVGVLLCLLRTHQSCGSTAMVTICNVEVGHLGKTLGDGLDVVIIAHHPEFVSETINRCNEIILRLSLGILIDECQQHVVIRISKEHRLDVGIIHTHMLHSVFLLVGTCQLMLLDDPRLVVTAVSTHHNAILGFLLIAVSRQA